MYIYELIPHCKTDSNARSRKFDHTFNTSCLNIKPLNNAYLQLGTTSKVHLVHYYNSLGGGCVVLQLLKRWWQWNLKVVFSKLLMILQNIVWNHTWNFALKISSNAFPLEHSCRSFFLNARKLLSKWTCITRYFHIAFIVRKPYLPLLYRNQSKFTSITTNSLCIRHTNFFWSYNQSQASKVLFMGIYLTKVL